MRKDTIFHVQFINPALNGEQNLYFGSVSAIFHYLSKDEVGVCSSTLYKVFKTKSVYASSECIISKSNIIRKPNKK